MSLNKRKVFRSPIFWIGLACLLVPTLWPVADSAFALIFDRNISSSANILPSKIMGGSGGFGGGKTFYVNALASRAQNFPSDSTFATIQLALNACVTDRGDVVLVAPASYAITVPLTMTKDNVKLMALDQPAAGSQNVYITTTDAASSATDLIQIDANDIVVSGLKFTPGNDCVNAIDIADTSVSDNILIYNCRFAMTGSAASSIGVRIGDATAAATRGSHTVVRGCQFEGCKGYAAQINAPFARISECYANLAAATTGFATGDPGADVEMYGYFEIDHNIVTGNTNASNEPFFTALGVESHTGIGVIHDNLIHGAKGTDDIHPEMWINNYLGNEAGGALYDPKT